MPGTAMGGTRSTYVSRGEIPREADVLRTRTGRTYLVTEVRGRQLELRVVPPDIETTGDTWEWEWDRRKRRRHMSPRGATNA